LLGKICRHTNRKERATKYFEMSLRLDPFLWTSFEAIAELGVSDVETSELFGITIPYTTKSSICDVKTPLQPMETPASATHPKTHLFPPSTAFRNRTVHFETPGLTPIAVNASLMPAETPKSASNAQRQDVPNVLKRAREVASRQYYPPSPETPITTVARSMRYLRGLGKDDGSTPSRSKNLNDTFGRSLFSLENQASNATTVKQRVLNGEQLEKPAATETVDGNVRHILELLCSMGKAYQCLRSYNCKEALQILQTLPLRQQATAWVLHQEGRAYLELNEFASAERCLEQMQIVDPGRMKGLELLSTVYWQVKKEVELAHLAQRVTDWDRESPEAWCVVGNCFSLQKDHETALTFFSRSLQLNPNFTYTHTLSGYEYMANEDFVKAIACFRQALRTDDKHYNAWYGLGAIYQRQEKFDLAEYHFGKAVALHPTSSALRCNLGIAQFSNGKAYQALDTLSEAFHLDPRNPQARFQRASIYMALHRPEEALSELCKVRDVAPREATVHFSLGKVYKKLGRTKEAMKCFLTAMDLDPKGSQTIKSALEKLEEPDIDEGTGVGF
jgi:anaphase-promoting complex subunit 3